MSRRIQTSRFTSVARVVKALIPHPEVWIVMAKRIKE